MPDQAENLRQIYQDKYGEHFPRRPEERGSCRVITVASGKGGVGKTNLVVNMAVLLAQWGYRVAVIDADLGLANVDVLLKIVPDFNINHVIKGEKEIEDIVIRGPLNVKIVPGGSGLFNLANLDKGRREYLLEKFKYMEREGDYLFVDASAGISRNVLSFIGAADELIIVTTPEPTAVADAYGMLKAVSETGCKNRAGIVVNCAQHVQQGEKVFARLNHVALSYLAGMELRYLGEINYDPAVIRAVHEGIPFVLSYPRSPAAASLARVAGRLVYRDHANGYDATGKGGGFLNRFYRFVTDERGRSFGN